MYRSWIVSLFCFGSLLSATLLAQDPFAAQVRPTDPLSPDEERRSFTLPPGFEIQLVASEPEILKPMNMAFDAKGRLWITESTEYPYPAPSTRKGRDNVKILEDTDGDGRADRITTFAEGLNIPIGLSPYREGAIVFSIPYIWFLRDTDGDGTADERRKLYGPFGHERDTHGLNNSFRRGFDGWMYACHGFNNVTEVAGDDGHTIRMHSGNVYRFRLDGSRIEVYTRGQVNPFGMTMDPLFNLFTADCHSKPINRLLRGGYHPSFGKPHDGLGFIPPMMHHTHGSTAIAGLACYTASQFPEPYRGDMFSGNVMTSRVNRNSLVFHGTTIRANKEADFVVTSDPWFRPVDIRVGPDGALYIADFYNRIIGHYEVPLDHPGRDRFRGRIWRIVYTGAQESQADDGGQRQRGPECDTAGASLRSFPGKAPDLSRAGLDALIEALAHENLSVRRLAMDELVDRIGEGAVDRVRQAFQQSEGHRLRSHALWVLHRLDGLSEDVLYRAANDAHRPVRVHAMKVLSEIREWSAGEGELARLGVQDEDPFVQLAAADALGQHPMPEHIRPLLDLLARVPEDDRHLRHAVRIALRNQLRRPEHFAAVPYEKLADADARAVAGVCLALESGRAASFLVEHMQQVEIPLPRLKGFVEHAARHVPQRQTSPLVRLIRERFATNVDFQSELFSSVHRGLQQRGSGVPQSVRVWGAELAGRLLDSIDSESRGWVNAPLPGRTVEENPWVLERRPSTDDQEEPLLSSRPRGEQLTGVLRSKEFEIPERLQFFLAGHNGPPGQQKTAENMVRLRAAGTGRILAESSPPGNDVAQPVRWDLSAVAGQKGYLELVDGRDERGYAWLAVGRFDPSIVPVPRLDPHLVTRRETAAAEIAAGLQLQTLKPHLSRLVTAQRVDASVRKAAAEALVALNPDARLASLAALIGEPAISDRLRRQMGRVLTGKESDPEQVREVLAETAQLVSQRLQVQLAQTLAGDGAGAETLLALVEQGRASARLLLNGTVRSKLEAALPDERKPVLERLTAKVPPVAEAVEKLIARRREGYRRSDASTERGKAVFGKHCAVCHQVEGEGTLIGPQLDGIGTRGPERLIEDILDPNRNVDVAFRTTTLVLQSGRVVTGLFRREAGALLVLADEKGDEFTVAKKDVVQRVRSQTSLMPENAGEILSEQEFYDLTAFLLSQTDRPQTESRDRGLPGGNE